HEIRALEGFAVFALPPSMDDLHAQAFAGPIVTVNVSGYRSDALILTPNAVTAVPLPMVTTQVLEEQVRAFQAALNQTAISGSISQHEAAQQAVMQVLAWLWDAVAEPVLCHMGYTGVTTQRQRIWWSPGGLLTLLPLHAAGH